MPETLAETCDRHAKAWLDRLFDPTEDRTKADEYLARFHACQELAEQARRQGV